TPVAPKPPCLHERLMSEIRSGDFRLRPTETTVKPSVAELYLSERHQRKVNGARRRPQSEIFTSGGKLPSIDLEWCYLHQRCQCPSNCDIDHLDSPTVLNRLDSFVSKRNLSGKR